MQTDLSTQTLDRARPVHARSAGLPDRAAFYLLASIIVGFLAASARRPRSTPPTPAEWGFSPITTTVVFGIYALAVLVALLVLGSLSDHVGRRPVLLAALAVQAAAMVRLRVADGVPQLVARARGRRVWRPARRPARSAPG